MGIWVAQLVKRLTRFQLRQWSHSSWDTAPRQGSALTAQSLLGILSLPLSLSLLSLPLSLCPFPAHPNFFYCFLFFLILILERKREHEWGRGADKEKENLKQALHTAQSLTWGWIPWPWDHNLSQNHASDTQPSKPPWWPQHFLLI